ncbi:MAG: IS66 family insertion sequence element accessory protein TnpB [Bacilli bacterium]
MINNLLKDIATIYIAYGSTDFRKQIYSLCSIVKNQFNLNPYSKAAFVFCNKKRNSIKVLCYDKNGFVLAQKKLLATEKMKFEWPRNKEEMKIITKEQLNWLLSGLKIYPQKYFKEIEINEEKVAI